MSCSVFFVACSAQARIKLTNNEYQNIDTFNDKTTVSHVIYWTPKIRVQRF